MAMTSQRNTPCGTRLANQTPIQPPRPAPGSMTRPCFHEIAPPEKISYRMRSLIQWVNAAETRRSTHITRLAAKAHHQLLHIYPFPQHSGKVARLTMNVLLMSEGYPPAILHATERQRYYEALKHSEDATARLVQQALVTSVESGIRFFEEH